MQLFFVNENQILLIEVNFQHALKHNRCEKNLRIFLLNEMQTQKQRTDHAGSSNHTERKYKKKHL